MAYIGKGRIEQGERREGGRKAWTTGKKERKNKKKEGRREGNTNIWKGEHEGLY